MPITQSRFAAMIHAARSFYDLLDTIRESAADTYDRLAKDELTAQQAADELYATATRWQTKPEHYMTLGTEERHYKLTRSRNARSAEKMRQRRQDDGTAPRTAPTPRSRAKLGPTNTGTTFDIEEDDQVVNSDDAIGTIPPGLSGIDYEALARAAADAIDKDKGK